MEIRLGRNAEPEAMTNDLRVEIVKVALEKVSDVCRIISHFHSISDTVYAY